MTNGTKTGQHGTAAQKSQQPQARTSAARNLLGFVPYLARYRPAIALGLLALVLTSIVGNIIPLATGVMTDILAGSPRPFETNTHAQALAGGWLNRDIPFYAPHSRHPLGIYCLFLIFCVPPQGALSFPPPLVFLRASPPLQIPPSPRKARKTFPASASSVPTPRKKPKTAASTSPIANTWLATSSSFAPGACLCHRCRRSSAFPSSSYSGKAAINFCAARFLSAP